MKNNIKGFTLIEVLIVIGLMGILMTVAYPSLNQWQKNAQYKAVARQLSGAMMEARSRAIAQNLEHEIVFDLVANTYKLNQLSEDGSVVTLIYNNQTFPASIKIKARSDCSESADIDYKFQFLPNGVFKNNDGIVGEDYICIMDKVSDARKFQVGIPAAATGRVVLTK